jgi:VanZ family protein
MTRSELAQKARRLQPWFRAVVWICLGVLVVLSLVPGAERPHTGYPGKFEHMIAYAGAGLFIVLAHERLRPRLTFWAGVATLSFVLEYLQNFSPGRGPSIDDALASSLGLTAGMTLTAVLLAALVPRSG